MLPVQILAQSLLCGFAPMGIPLGGADGGYPKQACRWETRSIKSFLAFSGRSVRYSIIHMIRTGKAPFVYSRPAGALLASALIVAAVTLLVGFTTLSGRLDMAMIAPQFAPWLVLLLAGYCAFAQLFKALSVRRFGKWLWASPGHIHKPRERVALLSQRRNDVPAPFVGVALGVVHVKEQDHPRPGLGALSDNLL